MIYKNRKYYTRIYVDSLLHRDIGRSGNEDRGGLMTIDDDIGWVGLPRAT